MKYPPSGAHPGVLHYITPNICAFEPTKPLVRSLSINTLIWIGGMSDTLLSVSYPSALAQALGLNWSIVTASLGSAGLAWGVSSIARDADEMAKIVSYFREKRPGGKIVIMGHSTGCQDCMEYVVGAKAAERPPVDGIILQAPVSDREALEHVLPAEHLRTTNQLALRMCRQRRDRDAMPHGLTAPVFGRTAITARRWVDIASPGPDHDGADDYFSADLSDERLRKTFGRLPATAPLLILYSGEDESLPASTDKAGLVQRWAGIVQAGSGTLDSANSGVVAGASHNLNGQSEDIVQDLVRRVNAFVVWLEIRSTGGQKSANI